MRESRVELNEELAKELDDEERREKNKKVLKILSATIEVVPFPQS